MDYPVIVVDEEAKSGVRDREEKVDEGDTQGGVSQSDSEGDVVDSKCVKYDIGDVQKGNDVVFCHMRLK